MKIDQTIEYEVFKKHESNREVNEALVQQLLESVSKKNLLGLRPVLVDENFFVIDGQHRLEVAKRLGIPVHYQIYDKKCSAHDMVLLNNNQKSWTINDYLNFYVNEGYEQYMLLKEYVDKDKLKLNIALRLLNGSRSSDFFRKFREGLYTFPQGEEYLEVMQKRELIKETIDFIKRKTSGPKMYLDRVTFYGALVDFFNIKSFSYQIFANKLHFKIDLIHPCTRQLDYVKLFKDIYNWKNKSPIEVEAESEYQEE